MVYYGIVAVAVTMFSIQFLFNQIFEKSYGNGMRAMLVFSGGSNLAGLIVLLIINKFNFEFTPFSLLMAILSALNMMAYNYCSLKALGKINLSLFSVFAMLGGMALPFAVGIIFFNEELTLGKSICFIIILASLFLTVKKDNSKSGYIYYAGIFVLNGLSGVLSTVFQSSDYEKTSAEGYSILIAVCCSIFSFVLLPFFKSDKTKLNLKACMSMAGYGILSRVANLLLLIALVYLPASAQYPFVTGGVMILSTVICFFTPEKPNKKDIAAVVLSFIGLIILMFVS